MYVFLDKTEANQVIRYHEKMRLPQKIAYIDSGSQLSMHCNFSLSLGMSWTTTERINNLYSINDVKGRHTMERNQACHFTNDEKQ